MTEIKNVLFVHPQGIGDVLLMTPAITGLRMSYPCVRIGVFLKSNAEYAVLKDSKYIDMAFLHDRKSSSLFQKIRLLLQIRREFKPDACIIVPEGSVVMNRLFSWLVGATRTALVKSAEPLSGYGNFSSAGAHKTTRIITAVREIFPDFKEGNTFFQLSPGDEILADAKWAQLGLPGRTVLGIHPGTDKTTIAKRYAVTGFVKIISSFLGKHPDSRCLIFIGPDDISLENTFLSVSDPRIVIVKDLSLSLVAGLIKRCRLFLAGDSGLAHLSAAVGTSIVSIYGPTNPNIVKPYCGNIVIIRHTPVLECMPCYYNDLFKLCAHRKCLAEILPSDVVDVLVKEWGDAKAL